MNIDEFFQTLDTMFSQSRTPEEIDCYLCESLAKANEEKDYGAYVSIGNEMIGFYRSISEYEKCFQISEDTLMLMEELQLDGTEHFATTLLNVATGYRAAGRLNESLSYYARALQLYEQLLQPGDYRFAGIYNNISILLEQLNENEKAVIFLERALEIIDKIPEGASEQASTRTNLALVKIKLGNMDEAEALLQDALTRYEALEAESSDAHYSAALAGIAEVYFKKEQYQEALSYYEKAAEEVKKHFGENESYQLLLQNVELVKSHLQ
jgi:tetratricopeptide (TPR) repeat protein